MTRKIVSLLFFLWMTQAYAAINIADEKISIQNVTQPELYVFCSKKQTTLILDRVGFERGASAGWSTQLMPFACTILFTDRSPFVFSCRQESSGAWLSVDCGQYILASRFPWSGAMLSADAPLGAHWVAENITADEIPMVLRHQGFDV